MSGKMRKLRRLRAKQRAKIVLHPHFVSERHTEKALAFQREIEAALAFQRQLEGSAKLVEESKRQAFLRFRDENYVASLLLEGLEVSSFDLPTTLSALRSRYAR